MPSRLLILLACSLLVFLSSCQEKGPGSLAFNSDFAIKDTSKIDKVVLTDTRNIVLSLEKTSEEWIANGKEAVRSDFIESLLVTFFRMKKKHPVPKNLRAKVLEKMNTMSKKVEVFADGKKVREMYLSSAPNTDFGSYMYLKGDDMPYVVTVPGSMGNLDARFIAEIEAWKSHEIFKYTIDEIKRIEVSYPLEKLTSFAINQSKSDNFELEKEGKAEPLSKLKALSFFSSFQNINAETFDNSFSKKDSIVSSTPHAVIRVTDHKDRSTTATLYRMPNNRRSKTMYVEGERIPYDLDRYFATIRDGKEFVVVQHYVFEKILRKYEDFL